MSGINHLPLAQGASDNVLLRCAPTRDFIAAVNEQVGGIGEPAEGRFEPADLGQAAALRSERLVLDRG